MAATVKQRTCGLTARRWFSLENIKLPKVALSIRAIVVEIKVSWKKVEIMSRSQVFSA